MMDFFHLPQPVSSISCHSFAIFWTLIVSIIPTLVLRLLPCAWTPGMSGNPYREPSLNSIWEVTRWLWLSWFWSSGKRRVIFLDWVWNSPSLLTSILSQKQQISFRKFVLEIYYGVNTGENWKGREIVISTLTYWNILIPNVEHFIKILFI